MSPASMAVTDNRKSSVMLKTPEAAAAPPATSATAAGMGKPMASAKTTAATAICPWRTTNEKKSFMVEVSIKKKGVPRTAPVVSRIELLHTGFLQHFHAHHMDLILIGINVCADLDVMTVMSFQCFGIHNIPRFLICVRYEGDFVAFSLDCALK